MTHHSQRSVLIVDDDRLVGSMAVRHASAAGYEARATVDPHEFLELATRDRPAFVIVDLVMEQMDGLTVLRSLAETGSRSVVIVSSGMGSSVLDAARKFAAESGLAYGGVLPKPFRASDVARVLAAGNARPTEALPLRDPLGCLSDDEFETHLCEAVDERHLRSYVQPQVSLADGRVTGFEALARWQHPRWGLLAPASFVPRAERLGLMPTLTRSVADHALEWFGSTRLDASVTLSLNVSAAEVSQDSLIATLRHGCRRASVDPTRVILELTETTAFQDAVVSLEVLTRLRIEGFCLAIDDFGTGYASVAQLARLPVTEVKIDRSFVTDLRSSERSRVMVRSMLQMAQGLDLSTVAEGVEDDESLGLLREMGCANAQGYFIARPMPVDAVIPWLRASGRSTGSA